VPAAPAASSAPGTAGAAALAIFDLDGTISRRDTLLPYLYGYLLRHPARLWRALLCLGPLLRFALPGRDRGALKSAIIRHTLGGLTRAQLAEWNRLFLARLGDGGLFAEALERIRIHRNEGARLVLLSASPDLYVPELARALGFDECLCTQLRWHEDERLDGALLSANRRGEEKVRCVRQLLAAHPGPGRSCAYGNSPADLAHLVLVSDGYYINGTLPARRASAAARYAEPGRLRVLSWRTPGRLATGLALPAGGGHNPR